ncbi:MAG: CNNM domain-containing protein [Verrucomicrobiales bacterium]|nr:CNNM domain-containing protein [Verrucomicrobiales bacterium]
MPTLTIAAILLCLALSFLLSGMEAGVFALSRLRVRQQMRAGRASARVLHGFLENPENFLWTIVVGNTLVNIAVLGWLIAALHDAFARRPLAFVLVYAVAVFLFYALFDLLPKMLFRTYPNRLCLWAARPFRWVHVALRPLVALVEGASALLLRWTGGRAFTGRLFGNREELRQVMQESAQALSSEERAMINRVLDLQTLSVRQITTPLDRAVTVEAQTPVAEVLRLARERGLSRFPVWEQRSEGRRIIGLVDVNRLLFLPKLDPAQPVAAHVQPAVYLEEDLRLEAALRRMQRGGQRLAIVVGRDRQELGIVSLGDILKTIFGEVQL